MKIFFKLIRTFSLSYTNLFKNLNETNSILGKQNLLKLTQVKVEKLKQTDFHRQTTYRRLLKNWLIKKKKKNHGRSHRDSIKQKQDNLDVT